MCEPLIAKSHFSASFEKAGGCPTPEEWASNKEALQSVLIWFWDARTTYPQNVKNASYSSERVSKCVCVCVCGSGCLCLYRGVRMHDRKCSYIHTITILVRMS